MQEESTPGWRKHVCASQALGPALPRRGIPAAARQVWPSWPHPLRGAYPKPCDARHAPYGVSATHLDRSLLVLLIFGFAVEPPLSKPSTGANAGSCREAVFEPEARSLRSASWSRARRLRRRAGYRALYARRCEPGACFLGYFLCTRKESNSPAVREPRLRTTHSTNARVARSTLLCRILDN